jgi:hypothetical protein
MAKTQAAAIMMVPYPPVIPRRIGVKPCPPSQRGSEDQESEIKNQKSVVRFRFSWRFGSISGRMSSKIV